MGRILVADDESAMRDMIGMACKMDGHEVHTSFDTPSTVAMFVEVTPDLLILDLAMPGGGGIEVLRHLESAAVLTCPVIIVSGYVAEVGSQGRAALAKHRIIEKPFALETLRVAVRETLGG